MKQIKEPKKINRRKFVARAGAGAAITMVLPFLPSCENSSSERKKAALNTNIDPDIELNLNAVQREASILPGNKTKVWVFEAELIKGKQEVLEPLEGSYLGPTIKVRRGQKVRIHFQNQLPEESIVHWHGLHVPEQYDGHPNDVIDSGETYTYEFEVMNRAGTYWYHPHPHGRIGPQVYNGLAGMLLVSDEEEEKLNLPKGEYDMPVVIQDRTFDDNNQLVYLNGGRMDRMTGFLGDQILINGDPAQTLNLKAGCAYRLRLLNGSNSRIYKLGWSDNRPLTVLGIDGSLLSSSKELPYLMLGPGKRADLWLDLEEMPQGGELTMNSLSFPMESMPHGRMDNGGMMGAATSKIPNGSAYPVLTIKTATSDSNNYTLPNQLIPSQPISLASANNAENPRQFTFAMAHMEWTINGRTWHPTEVSDEEKVSLNTTEVWELINGGGMMGGQHGMMGDDDGSGMMDGRGMMGDHGMMGGEGQGMMQMPHPIHIHQVQFNMAERNVDEVDPDLWDSIKDGFIDEGWHDTVLLMPGMRAKVLMEFKNFKGKFVYHCHNLEHEDSGMMRNFQIT